MNRLPLILAANALATAQVCAMTAAVGLQAAAEGDVLKLRQFAMEAYNGGLMRFEWSDVPVVVDLAGLDITEKSRPILLDHKTDQRIGHTTKAWVQDGKTFQLTGAVSGTSAAAQEVVGTADRGFPWQASIGVSMLRAEEIRAGESVTVNSQTFEGPLLVVRASRLKEVSFVALGADDSTQARMIAALPQNTPTLKGYTMDFDAWVTSLGLDPATITPEQKTALQQAFDALQASVKAKAEAAKKPEDQSVAAAAKTADLKAKAALEGVRKLVAAAIAAPAPVVDPALSDATKNMRAEAAAESDRISGIRKLCANGNSDIEAQAIREGWTVDKTDLHILRASRATAPNINTGAGSVGMTDQVLEAAACIAGRISNLDKRFDDNVLEAASKAFRTPISLNQLVIMAARANGYHGGGIKVDREILRAAFALQAGAFSTIDTSGILSNIANKSILDAFLAVDQSWRKISAISPVSDFKAITRYRMTGDNTYEEVNAAGQIKHGKLGEESFTNQAKTYAKMLGITRTDFKNDDLGALTKVPQMLGRGAALKLNEVFWAAFLADHSTFFPTDNSKLNYFEGSPGSLLSIDGLSTAEQMFLDQVDADGKPLAISPAILLVPTGLSAKAAALMNSTELRDTTASTKYPVANPHAGKFEVVVSPYLNKTAMGGGYSATAWYTLADPKDLAVIETVFLDGQESPTVETAEADFSTLGVQMRGFHDFGVAKQDYRAGVKAKGAA